MTQDPHNPLSTPPPHRAKPTVINYYAQLATTEARRLGRKITRDNIIAILKTMVWVVPLTLLIWVYAESENRQNALGIQASIEVHSANPDLTVTLLYPPEHQILCDLSGPHANLERVRESLNPANPLTIELSKTLAVGPHDVPTRSLVENNERFVDEGISVDKASPDFLSIYVDELYSQDVPVVAPEGILSLQSATFTPPTVKITGPRRLIDEFMKEKHNVVADLSTLPILNTPGEHPPISVSLRTVDPTGQITCSVTTVQAALTVKEADVAYTIINMPIYVMANSDLVNQYKISFDTPIYPSVKVVGPADQIDEIASKQVHPIAAVQIDDVKAAKTRKLIILNLPPDVRVAPGQDLEVSFTPTGR